MATTDKLPDKCLVCYSTNVISKQCSRGPIHKNGSPSSPSLLDKHLENIFILRNVLEVPLGNLQGYLMSWNYPEIWISLCQNCKTVIDEAKSLHFEMVAALKRFKKVKERVVQMSRLSNANEETCVDFWKSPNNFITNQTRKFASIHEYGDFTDPFMEGDKKAKHLANPETTFTLEMSLKETINPIKLEVSLTEDFAVEDNQDLYFDEMYNDDDTLEENIEINLQSIPKGKREKSSDNLAYENDIEDFHPFNAGSTRGKTIKCDKCTRFIKPDLMPEHLKLHERSPYDCKLCGNVFKNRHGLSNHRAKYHRHRREGKQRLSSDQTRKNNNMANDCDSISFKNGNINEIQNWKSDIDPTSSTRPCSTRNSGGERNETGDKIEKTLIDCPLCGNVRFMVMNGKSRKLLQHLENCKVLKGKNISEEALRSKNITCQLCKKCNITSSEKFACFEHLLSCDGKFQNCRIQLTNRIFECNVCPSTRYFQLEDFINHHMEHSRNTYKCTKCPRRFPLTSKIVHHWKSQHFEAMKTVQPLCRFTKMVAIPEVPWWCPICSSKFNNEYLRDLHVETDHKTDKIEKTHTCTQCSKMYYCINELRLHEETIHADKTGKLVKCDLCNSLFATKKQLQRHRMKKHRVDLLICDICGTECNCPTSLTVHMQLHQDMKKFSCHECNQSFTTRHYLRNHKYRDHAERDPKINPLVCPHCNRIFYNKSYLQKHISGVHQGNFKFHCHICNQGCQHESQLKKHVAVKHKIGEVNKKYLCTLAGCVAAFNCRSKLMTHLSQHAGKPQFTCKFCGKEFFKKEHLHRHELIHTNAESKPYQCEICAKRFPVRNYLYIHMRSHGKSN